MTVLACGAFPSGRSRSARPEQRAQLMAVVESLGSYDSETHTDGSRITVVRLVDLLGPISPELVLVDPQLAAHARALLSDVSTTRPSQRRERETPASAPWSPAPGRQTPWKLLGACAVVAAAASTGFGVWTTIAGNDHDLSSQPSVATGPTFFSTPPIEPGLSPDAIAALEEEARRTPRSPLAREALGNAYFRLGRWEDAEVEFRALVELSPSDDFAHYALGRALANQGRQREAALEFKRAGSLSEGGK